MGIFRFKQFQVDDTGCAMKIGTDGVLLGAWTLTTDNGQRTTEIIDAGCGSGLIALMLAQRFQGAMVKGIEIDADAARVAAANAAASPWKDRVSVVQADVLEWSPGVDVSNCPLTIVSNPPFFTETLRSPSDTRALARHGEGLNVESLITWAARLMKAGRGDSLSFIAPAAQEADIRFALSLNRLALSRLTRVIPKPGLRPLRLLVEARIDKDVTSLCDLSALHLRNTDGSLTDEYKHLTRYFYLK